MTAVDATPTQRRNPWLPFPVSEDARVRLLCFPHAGAGASTYRAWAAGMPPFIGVCPVQPPGRENRRRHAPLTNVHDLVTQCTDEVLHIFDAPYALFGHSTGALAAYVFAQEARRRGLPAPVHLFVAGRRAPQIPMRRTELAGLAMDDLVSVLRGLGGTPEELLADHGLLRLLQPLLAADFCVNESYCHEDEPPLNVPITSFAASCDPGATPEQTNAWAARTSGTFIQHTLDGGHFAVLQDAARVHAWISDALNPDPAG